MADQSSTPQKIALNLDNSTRSEAPEPLVVVIGGEPVKFNDPVELEYRVLDKVDHPDSFAKYCVSDESRQHFKKQQLPVWKFRELSQLYMEHYKVDELLGN